VRSVVHDFRRWILAVSSSSEVQSSNRPEPESGTFGDQEFPYFSLMIYKRKETCWQTIPDKSGILIEHEQWGKHMQ